jgi:hypothetical protein
MTRGIPSSTRYSVHLVCVGIHSRFAPVKAFHRPAVCGLVRSPTSVCPSTTLLSILAFFVSACATPRQTGASGSGYLKKYQNIEVIDQNEWKEKEFNAALRKPVGPEMFAGVLMSDMPEALQKAIT